MGKLSLRYLFMDKEYRKEFAMYESMKRDFQSKLLRKEMEKIKESKEKNGQER